MRLPWRREPSPLEKLLRKAGPGSGAVVAKRYADRRRARAYEAMLQGFMSPEGAAYLDTRSEERKARSRAILQQIVDEDREVLDALDGCRYCGAPDGVACDRAEEQGHPPGAIEGRETVQASLAKFARRTDRP